MTPAGKKDPLPAAALLEPGPARTAAIDAGAAQLLMHVGICGDRGRALAGAVLMAGVVAAQGATNA